MLLKDIDITNTNFKLKLNNDNYKYCSCCCKEDEFFIFIVYHNELNDINISELNDTKQNLLWENKIVIEKGYKCSIIRFYDSVIIEIIKNGDIK